MSGQNLRAILWLRWRLTRNGLAKSGLAGAVVGVVLGVGGAGLAVLGLVGGLLGGSLGLHGASPAAVMWTWLGLTIVFSFSWTLGVLVDLQRSELIDLPRLMHLPIELRWAFLVNYVASLFGATLAFFAPAMIGLCLGLVFDRGPMMLLLVPLAIGLLFMVTAWTYLFQGFIAAWAQNPRRRRALITALVLCVAMLGQLPNVVVHGVFRSPPQENAGPSPGAQTFPCGRATCTAEQACADPCCGETFRWKYRYAPALDFMPRDDDSCAPCAKAAGVSVAKEPSCVDARTAIHATRQRHAEQEEWSHLSGAVVNAEKLVPPLWVAAGARGLAQGEPLAALLGTLGFVALGLLALQRGYRTTLRFYAGADGSRSAAIVHSRELRASAPAARQLVERTIIGVGDQTAAIAVATLRSMLRAPEIMMSQGASLVMLPISMLVILGVTHHSPAHLSAHVRPLVVAGAMSVVNLTLSQILNNQFGHDRDALRALLLAPVPRRRILLGKNIAVLALGVPACSILLAASAVWLRLPPLAAVAAVAQMATIFLIAAIVGNLASILIPYRVAPGSMNATKLPPAALLVIIGSMFALPVLSFPAFAGPLAVIAGHYLGWKHPIVADFSISLVMAAAALGAYAASLGPLGELLQRRETRIVARVTAMQE